MIHEPWDAEKLNAEVKALRAENERLCLAVSDAQHNESEYRRIIREMDETMNGREGMAEQAMLCDIQGQLDDILRERERLRATVARVRNVIAAEQLGGIDAAFHAVEWGSSTQDIFGDSETAAVDEAVLEFGRKIEAALEQK